MAGKEFWSDRCMYRASAFREFCGMTLGCTAERVAESENWRDIWE